MHVATAAHAARHLLPYVLLVARPSLALGRRPRLPAGPPGRALLPGVRARPAVRQAGRVGRAGQLPRRWSPTPTCGGSPCARWSSASSTPRLTMAIGVGARAADAAHVQAGPDPRCRPGCCSPGRCRSLAALTVWQWLFDTQYGVVNWLLTKLGARLRGPLLAARAAVLLLRRHRDRGLDERAVRRVHRVRRAHAGARGPRRGRRDRRRRPGAAAAARRAPDASARCCWSSGCSRSSGTCGCSPRSTCCRRPAASPATPTCSAPTSTGSASAAATSAWPPRSRSSCSSLTVVLTAPYVRAMLQAGEGRH